MPEPIFTIGHSTRSLETFIELLQASQVRHIADVRTLPGSTRHPQFNQEPLRAALAERQIGYSHFRALGGRRPRQPAVPEDVNAYWTVRSFHNYADYALGPDFAEGLAALRALAADRRCTLMCAEAVWWRCHRRLIADHLLAAGEAVFHILEADDVRPAVLTPGAVVGQDGRVRYPAPPSEPSLFPEAP